MGVQVRTSSWCRVYESSLLCPSACFCEDGSIAVEACHVVLLSGARCDRGSRREGGDAPYVDKDQLKWGLFNEDLSPQEAGVAGVSTR
jgi:hypothetical protein